MHQHAGFLAAGDTVGVGVLLAEFAGDHHFDVAALECGEVLFGDLLLQRHQTVEPVLHHVARNLFHCGGRRAGAWRVDERERRGEARLAHHVHGLLEVLLGFTGESDDDIGGNLCVGHGLADTTEDIEELGGPVGAAHRAQDAVGAGLQREVQLMHDIRRFGHGCNHIIGEGGRVRRSEAHTFETVDGSAGAQQLAESVSIADAVAERVHVLAEERDFLGAAGHALADLIKNVTGAAVLFLASRGGHDAERAGVIAAHGNRHPRADAGGAGGGKLARELPQLFSDLDLRLAGRTILIQQLGQIFDVLGTEHRGNPWRSIRDLLAVKLGHAAANGDLQVRPNQFDAIESANGAIHAFGCVLAYRTGIEHQQIEVIVIDLVLGCRHVAIGLQHAGDALGIVHVHLAAERVDMEYALSTLPQQAIGSIGCNRGTLRLGHHVFIHNDRFYRRGSSCSGHVCHWLSRCQIMGSWKDSPLTSRLAGIHRVYWWT